ncbi:MAG TPA: MarR family transcriptional regulator [Acidimicrobiales bacterium]|nr:MarR family transcriptional regulator [Acidimicrobiales bacterium]
MDTDTTQETAARLRRAVTRLHRRLRASALGGVSPAQASLLASVERLESPSLGELALAEQVTPPTVTKAVQSLEEAGLLTCSPDPDDRRSTRVRLTPNGRREVATIRRRKTEFLEGALRQLSPADRKRARDAVDFLETLVEGS